MLSFRSAQRSSYATEPVSGSSRRAGMAVHADDFSATQIRFSTTVVRAVDIELSRYGTYTAVADGTEGNSVRVLDENWELLWRHKLQVYWADTFKHASIVQFAQDESFLVFPAYRTENDIALVNPKNRRPHLRSDRPHRHRRLPFPEPRRNENDERLFK